MLLPYDLIATAESASATVSCDPAIYLGNKLDLRLGIDFGRTNDPTVCWTLERVGDVLVTREVLVLRNMSVPDQMEVLRHRIKAARRGATTIRAWDWHGRRAGQGVWALASEGHEFGKIELCTFTTAFKRLIFPRLRQAFESPPAVSASRSTWRCSEDLHAMQQIFLEARITPYEAPHTREGHPDRCTALALALRAADGHVQHHLPAPGSSRITKGAGLFGGCPTALSLAAVPPQPLNGSSIV